MSSCRWRQLAMAARSAPDGFPFERRDARVYALRMTDLATTRKILETLIGFDTTSRNSNLALVEWVEAYLDRHGASHRRVMSADGTKSNLLATIGPNVEGGAVLSGHTDVVPVDGQPWSTDPWTVTEKPDGKLYGRGTGDMKGFLAVALAH